MKEKLIMFGAGLVLALLVAVAACAFKRPAVPPYVLKATCTAGRAPERLVF